MLIGSGKYTEHAEDIDLESPWPSVVDLYSASENHFADVEVDEDSILSRLLSCVHISQVYS